MNGDLPSPGTIEISAGLDGPASLSPASAILIHAEQGFGDALQFVRFVPAVAARGGRVVLEVPQPLVRLVRTVAGAAQVVAAGDPLPAFDCHCPLLSLPRVLGTDQTSIPDTVPYLSVPAEASSAWAHRLAASSGLRVGVVWAGTTVGALDLRLLRPLWEVADISWFSLQVGDHSGDASLLDGVQIADLSPWLSDFAETAAAVCHLDLVITVDTAVAHLAGALGRPTWLVLPYASEWRWLLERRDSPWYPDRATIPPAKGGRLAWRDARGRRSPRSDRPALKRPMAECGATGYTGAAAATVCVNRNASPTADRDARSCRLHRVFDQSHRQPHFPDRERGHSGRRRGPEPTSGGAGLPGRLSGHGQDGTPEHPRQVPRGARHLHQLDDPLPLSPLLQAGAEHHMIGRLRSEGKMARYVLAVSLSLVLAVVELSGCTPQATVASSQDMIPAMAPGMARVWFLRGWDAPSGQSFVYGAAPIVSANGAPVGGIPVGAAFFRDFSPGTYSFTVEPYGLPTPHRSPSNWRLERRATCKPSG